MGWHRFMTEYVAYDAVRNNVINNCVVKKINTQGDGVSVTCGGATYTAWSVIVTVPMKILQKGEITFTPSLPSSYTQAIYRFIVGNGFKIWIEYEAGAQYKEYFTHEADAAMYKKSWNVRSPAEAATAGYRLFWNEGYPYGSSTKIVGGLIYGKAYNQYDGLSLEQKKNKIAEHLKRDNMVTGTPTGEWTVMDWKEEPYIEGAYTIFANEADQSTLLEPLSGNKLFFAGEALNEWTWGTVHGAAKTGRDQAKKIVDAGRRRE
jgi:monoamine oxidase